MKIRIYKIKKNQKKINSLLNYVETFYKVAPNVYREFEKETLCIHSSESKNELLIFVKFLRDESGGSLENIYKRYKRYVHAKCTKIKKKSWSGIILAWDLTKKGPLRSKKWQNYT